MAALVHGRRIIFGCIPLGLMLLIFVGVWGNPYTWMYLVPVIVNRDHQEFAVHGIQEIRPAAEMEAVFSDCRHYITYAGDPTEPVWNSVAYFGGRYELTMQVPVRVYSKTAGEIAGAPRYLLLELTAVQLRPDGSVEGATFGESHSFDYEQWQKVFESSGDFGTIGISLNQTPVPGFLQYAAFSRGS